MGRSLPSATVVVLAVFAVTGGIIWLAFSEAGTVYGEPPVIEAAVEPLKRAPDDPGGRQVAALDVVEDLLREPANGPTEDLLMPSPRRPLSPAEAAISSLTQDEAASELAPDPQKRNKTTAALQAIVEEIEDDVQASPSGAGGPVALPSRITDRFTAEDEAGRPIVSEARRTSGQDRVARLENSDVSSDNLRYHGTPGGKFRIQLAAVREEADAHRAWTTFREQLGQSIADLEPFIERADTKNGLFYRLQVGPFAQGRDAERLCGELQRNKVSCFVVRR